MSYLKFRTFLLENQIKSKDVAQLLGIDEAAFSKKINRKVYNGIRADFSLNEVRKICNAYSLSADEYFFIN